MGTGGVAEGRAQAPGAVVCAERVPSLAPTALREGVPPPLPGVGVGRGQRVGAGVGKGDAVGVGEGGAHIGVEVHTSDVCAGISA